MAALLDGEDMRSAGSRRTDLVPHAAVEAGGVHHAHRSAPGRGVRACHSKWAWLTPLARLWRSEARRRRLWWRPIRLRPPGGWPGRWRAWHPARPIRTRRPPAGVHALRQQFVVQRAQRQLAGADDHGVHLEQPRLAVDARVQAGVVDASGTRRRRPSARRGGSASCGASSRWCGPASCPARRPCAAAASPRARLLATCGTTPVTPPRGWFLKSMPHSRANTSMSARPTGRMRDQLGHVEADAAGAHDGHAPADRLAAQDHVDVGHHLGVLDARDGSGRRGSMPVATTTSSKPSAGSSAASARGVQPQRDAELVDHAAVVAQRLVELFLAGDALGQVELAADLGCRRRTASPRWPRCAATVA
jgi:hypothetical protein